MILFLTIVLFIIIIMIIWCYFRRTTSKLVNNQKSPNPSTDNFNNYVIVSDPSESKYLSWNIFPKTYTNPDTNEEFDVVDMKFDWVYDINESTVLIFHYHDVDYLEKHNIRPSFYKYWDNDIAYNLQYLSLPQFPVHCILEIDGNHILVRSVNMCRASNYALINDKEGLHMVDNKTVGLAQFKIIKLEYDF